MAQHTEIDGDNDVKAVADTDDLLLFRSASSSGRNHSTEVNIIVTAQLSGLFFQLASGSARQDTLICYRRNLFQVRGTIILPGDLDEIARQIGISSPVAALVTSLSATESTHQNQVAIISAPKGKVEHLVSPSSDAPAPFTVEHTSNGNSLDPISIAWTRLQFRTATAKSGRRKDKRGDKFFVAKIRICLRCEDKSEVLLSELQSVPIIVRGRSPRNFGSLKVAAVGCQNLATADHPGIEADSEERPEPTLTTSSSTDQALAARMNVPGEVSLESEDQGSWFNFSKPGMGPFSFGGTPVNYFNDTLDFTNADAHHLFDFDVEYEELRNFTLGEVEPDGSSEPEGHSTITAAYTMLQKAATASPPQPNGPVSESSQLSGTEKQEEKFYYEYIPLALDDRTPPVQAVYQPHGVHHKMILPKTSQGNSQRYFGEFSDTEGD